jgi:hypothetical protein
MAPASAATQDGITGMTSTGMTLIVAISIVAMRDGTVSTAGLSVRNPSAAGKSSTKCLHRAASPQWRGRFVWCHLPGRRVDPLTGGRKKGRGQNHNLKKTIDSGMQGRR